MAEYYPLLARAVASMHQAPAGQRKAIYDRARSALLGQLRSMQPPVPEESIARESTALDEAIGRLEGEIAGAAGVGPAASSPADAAAPPPPPDESPPEPTSPEPPSNEPPAAAARADMTMAAPVPRGPARPQANALSRIVAERTPSAPVIRATRDDDDGARNAPPLPSASRLQVPTFSDALADAVRRAPAGPTEADEPEIAEPAAAREDVLRPAAPRPTTRERFNPRALILAAVALAVVAGIGYAAWRLRDKPEALARSRAAMQATKPAEPEPAKVVTRADGAPPSGGGQSASPSPAPEPAPIPVPAAPASEAAAPAAAPAPSEAAVPKAAAPDAAPSGPAPAPAGAPAGIAVAQRAAFLVDAPDEPGRIKTYVGGVVWSTENASPTQGAPIARTVRADIDIPDAGMKMSLVFQKNYEAQFPASHTLELRFMPAPTSPLGGIKQINVPQMRKDDSQTGDPLLGLPVTITDNYFLVGLSRGDAIQRNLDLIQSRAWFDVPLLLNSGKIAKVTFEKGAAGQAAVNEVVASWQ